MSKSYAEHELKRNRPDDSFDRRIQKILDSDGPGGTAAVSEKYAYDGNELYLQFNGSNALTHRYIHGPAVDQILIDEDFSLPTANRYRWTLNDHQNSVRDIVDSQGSLVNHKAYDSFGRVTSETDTTAAADVIFGYTGRQLDQETGLQYNRARYYEADTGRFISTDPSGFVGGDYNLYRYTENSPLSHTDPSGLKAFNPTSTWYGAATEDGRNRAKTMLSDVITNSATAVLIGSAWTPQAGLLNSLRNELGFDYRDYRGQFAEGYVRPLVNGLLATVEQQNAQYERLLNFDPVGAIRSDIAFAMGWIGDSTISQAAELGNTFTSPERSRRIVNGITDEATSLINDFWGTSWSNHLHIDGGHMLPTDWAAEGALAVDRAAAARGREAVPYLDTIAMAVATEGLLRTYVPSTAVQAPSSVGKTGMMQRYLNGSGGRWGGTETRLLNDSIATQYENAGQGFRITGGAGRAAEEWIPGPGGGKLGGTFVDITATNGTRTVRIQTINTLADGATPTAYEAAAAARINAAFPNDQLRLIPKPH